MKALCVTHDGVPYYLIRKNIFSRNSSSIQMYVDDDGPKRVVDKWKLTNLSYVYLVEGSKLEDSIPVLLNEATFTYVSHTEIPHV